MPAEAMTAKPTRIPILSEPLREKIRALFPRYPSKRAVTLPALAPGPRAPAVRAATRRWPRSPSCWRSRRPKCTTR